MSNEPVLLSGHIHFAAGTQPFSGHLRVILEDVGRMDIAAPVVAEYRQDNFRYEGQPVTYAIRGNAAVDDTHRYSVRVHISQTGSDEFESGDYITTESYPALTPDGPSHLDVRVQKI